MSNSIDGSTDMKTQVVEEQTLTRESLIGRNYDYQKCGPRSDPDQKHIGSNIKK